MTSRPWTAKAYIVAATKKISCEIFSQIGALKGASVGDAYWAASTGTAGRATYSAFEISHTLLRRGWVSRTLSVQQEPRPSLDYSPRYGECRRQPHCQAIRDSRSDFYHLRRMLFFGSRPRSSRSGWFVPGWFLWLLPVAVKRLFLWGPKGLGSDAGDQQRHLPTVFR